MSSEDWMASEDLHDLLIALVSERDAEFPEEQVLQNRLFAMLDDNQEIMIPFDLPDSALEIDIQEIMGMAPIEDPDSND